MGSCGTSATTPFVSGSCRNRLSSQARPEVDLADFGFGADADAELDWTGRVAGNTPGLPTRVIPAKIR